ncbi:MAG: hypothetical protein MPL62_12425 [Alphaproteobacteria bacterium]|nr:hypothetical protein [Alphaproteobacteria bacterium]
MDPERRTDYAGLYKAIREGTYQNAESIIPDVFIDNIKQTSNERSIHKKEIINMICLSKMAAYLHPRWYISKSGVEVDSTSEYCKYPNVNGIVENAFRIFEKHYLDIICMLYAGSYEAIMTALRRGLERAAYITNSVTNKEDFTGRSAHKGRAMTYEELKNFVYYNERKSGRSSKDIKDPKDRWEKYRKDFSKIKDYTKHIEFNGKKSTEALDDIFDNLSKWAHANMWNEIVDGNPEIHNPDKIHLYMSKPNYEEFHTVLKEIKHVYEATLYMLLVAAYINVGYYNIESAKCFFEEMDTEIKTMSIKLPSIEKLIADPPFLEFHSLHVGLSTKCSECNMEIKNDYRCDDCENIQYVDCMVCNYPKVFGTRCIMCDVIDNDIEDSDD